jgi:hypothetical protein
MAGIQTAGFYSERLELPLLMSASGTKWELIPRRKSCPMVQPAFAKIPGAGPVRDRGRLWRRAHRPLARRYRGQPWAVRCMTPMSWMVDRPPHRSEWHGAEGWSAVRLPMESLRLVRPLEAKCRAVHPACGEIDAWNGRPGSGVWQGALRRVETGGWFYWNFACHDALPRYAAGWFNRVGKWKAGTGSCTGLRQVTVIAPAAWRRRPWTSGHRW